jgi:hypothetical protein
MRIRTLVIEAGPAPRYEAPADLEGYVTHRFVAACRAPGEHADSVGELYLRLRSYAEALLIARGEAARLFEYERARAEERRAMLLYRSEADRRRMAAVVEYFLELLEPTR